ALNARGIYVFFDKWDIAPGQSITKFMDQGIYESKFGLFICTPVSASRANEEHKWTGYEAIQFKVGKTMENKTIIPVLRSGDERNIPHYLQSLRWIDIRNQENF